MAGAPRFDPKKEAAFVREYLVDKNGAKAAVRAGYKDGPGARITAQRLLKKPKIREAIHQALAEQAQRTLITADENLRAIARIADKAEAEGDYGASLRGHELLGKHFRQFSEKVELTGKNDGPVEFTEIRRTIVRPTQKP